MEPIRDQQQSKPVAGEQKVLLDERITAETDELDPNFDSQSNKSEPNGGEQEEKENQNSKTDKL